MNLIYRSRAYLEQFKGPMLDPSTVKDGDYIFHMGIWKVKNNKKYYGFVIENESAISLRRFENPEIYWEYSHKHDLIFWTKNLHLADFMGDNYEIISKILAGEL